MKSPETEGFVNLKRMLEAKIKMAEENPERYGGKVEAEKQIKRNKDVLRDMNK